MMRINASTSLPGTSTASGFAFTNSTAISGYSHNGIRSQDHPRREADGHLLHQGLVHDENFFRLPAAEMCAAIDVKDIASPQPTSPEQYMALLDSAAFVNWRRIDQGQSAVLALSYHRQPP